MECVFENVCGSSAKDPEWACNESLEDRMKMCACFMIFMFQFKGIEFREIEFQQSLPTNKLEGGDLDYE